MPTTPPDFLKKIINQLPRLENEILDVVIAVEAENMWSENFRMEGFTDVVFTAWQPRKKPETPKRALLVKTSTLKGHALKGRKVGNHIDFVFPLEYEKVHNEGGQAGRGKGFQMPKRQFIGDSAQLNQRIQTKATAYINKRLNP